MLNSGKNFQHPLLGKCRTRRSEIAAWKGRRRKSCSAGMHTPQKLRGRRCRRRLWVDAACTARTPPPRWSCGRARVGSTYTHMVAYSGSMQHVLLLCTPCWHRHRRCGSACTNTLCCSRAPRCGTVVDSVDTLLGIVVLLLTSCFCFDSYRASHGLRRLVSLALGGGWCCSALGKK